MVEAAVFFPIAVFCAMAIMALLLNIYSQTATQAHIHVRLRAEAAAYGDRTKATLYDAYARDRYRKEAENVYFSVNESDGPLMGKLETTGVKTYYGGRFTNPFGYETGYYARSYIIDETAMARIGALAAGALQ